MAEIWKFIVGYEDLYEVSNLGFVRSLDRIVISKNGVEKHLRGQYLNAVIRPDEYRAVTLWKEGKSRTRIISHLVAEAFLGPRPIGYYVLHNEGDRSKNGLSDIRYGTPSDNSFDAVIHGTHPRLGEDHSGENAGNSKLTVIEVNEIRRRVASGESRKSLSIEFGVSYSTIKALIRRESWINA